MSNAETDQSCAIVVTYNPDITALLKLLGQLNKETDFVVIDNQGATVRSITLCR